MNLLFVSHCPPWPLDIGNSQRVYHLVDGLARRHRVTLVTLAAASSGHESGRDVLERCSRVIVIPSTSCRWAARNRFEAYCWALLSPYPTLVHQWYSDELRRTLADLRRSEHFDAVWVERSHTAEMVRRAGFEHFVVDIDDLDSAVRRRRIRHGRWNRSTLLDLVELGKVLLYEKTLASRFWRLVVCKDEDRAFFWGAGNRVFVVPNGTEVYPPSDPEAEKPGEVLFVGQLEYEPNVDAIHYFRNEVLPQLERLCGEVRFIIVGRAGKPEVLGLHDGRRCVVASSVPDLTPYFETASLVIVPMRLGSGTRLKVLEALARGKAVVSTSVGAEGLDLRPGVDLQIADDPQSFAHACAVLLKDPEARRRLAESGRARVLERYRWDVVAEAAERALLA